MLPVLGHFDARGRCADDLHPVGFEGRGEVEGRLTSELHDGGVALLALVDIEHVLQGKRLKVKFVTRVVVGGNGLGVRIDHHGFPAHLTEGKGGMDAAVIELDALPDTIRATAEDHDALFVVGARLVLVAVSGIKVRRVRLELRRAGVDQTVSRLDTRRDAGRADVRLLAASQMRQLPVRETVPFHASPWNGCEVFGTGLFLGHNLGQTVQEPRVNPRGRMDPLHSPSGKESVAKAENAVGRGNAYTFFQGLFVERSVRSGRRRVFAIRPEAGTPCFQGAQCFLHGFFEGSPDGHSLPHALHLRGEHGIRLRKFLESESWNFDHAVVDGRLEAGRRLSRDIVAQLVERVTDGQFRRDFGDWKSGGLRGERRRPRDPWIHLDDNHAPSLRAHRKLDV